MVIAFFEYPKRGPTEALRNGGFATPVFPAPLSAQPYGRLGVVRGVYPRARERTSGLPLVTTEPRNSAAWDFASLD